MVAPIKACVIQEILNTIHVYHKIMTILKPLQHLFKGSGNHSSISNAVLMAPHCTQKWRFEEVTTKTNTGTIKQFNIILGHAETFKSNCVINQNAMNCSLLAIINTLTCQGPQWKAFIKFSCKALKNYALGSKLNNTDCRNKLSEQ
jgi:hypothetical protein